MSCGDAAGTIFSTKAFYNSFPPMRLHQLKIDFAAEQDRLLMLIAASEKVEVRM